MCIMNILDSFNSYINYVDKIISYSPCYIAQSLDGMKDLVAESSIMKNFDHPNVLPLLGIRVDYDDEDVLKVVIPFMANGDLKTFLKNKRVAPSNTHEYSKVSS